MIILVGDAKENKCQPPQPMRGIHMGEEPSCLKKLQTPPSPRNGGNND